MNNFAVTPQAEVGGSAIAQHDRDQRSDEQYRDNAGGDQSAPEAQFADGQ